MIAVKFLTTGNFKISVCGCVSEKYHKYTAMQKYTWKNHGACFISEIQRWVTSPFHSYNHEFM